MCDHIFFRFRKIPEFSHSRFSIFFFLRKQEIHKGGVIINAIIVWTLMGY